MTQRTLLIVTAAAAIVARTIMIGRWPAINGDEAWYGVNVQEWIAGGTPFLRTGIGNLLNPLHSAPLLALSAVFPPSAGLLRAPEVIYGVLAVLLCYPLLRRPLGDRAAILATVFLAVSPAAVIYSRLGWDPSGGPLITLLAIACALSDRPWLALVSIALAWLVHPTNIFITPIVFAAWAPHGLARWRAATPETRTRLRRYAVAAIVLAIPASIWLAIRVAGNPQTSLPSIQMVIDRLTSPALWAARAWGFVNLLSGVSPVVHVATPLTPVVINVVNSLVSLIAIAALWAGGSRLSRHAHARWLLAGIAIAFIGFHIVAMDVALTPTSERYGIFMLVPMLIVLAIALEAAIDRHAIAGGIGAAAAASLMIVLLIGGYFVPLWQRGGDAMTTYRTGPREPKLSAFEFIEADSRTASSVSVVADGWWLYWTLRYFAGPNGRIHVEVTPGSNMPGGTHPAGAAVPAAPPAGRRYFVAFAGGALPEGRTPASARFTSFDPIGRPIVHVFETR